MLNSGFLFRSLALVSNILLLTALGCAYLTGAIDEYDGILSDWVFWASIVAGFNVAAFSVFVSWSNQLSAKLAKPGYNPRVSFKLFDPYHWHRREILRSTLGFLVLVNAICNAALGVNAAGYIIAKNLTFGLSYLPFYISAACITFTLSNLLLCVLTFVVCKAMGSIFMLVFTDAFIAFKKKF